MSQYRVSEQSFGSFMARGIRLPGSSEPILADHARTR